MPEGCLGPGLADGTGLAVIFCLRVTVGYKQESCQALACGCAGGDLPLFLAVFSRELASFLFPVRFRGSGTWIRFAANPGLETGPPASFCFSQPQVPNQPGA